MTRSLLLPTLPVCADEVTQGYFSRLGHFHAGVDVVRFCGYFGLRPPDLRDGTEEFANALVAVYGAEADAVDRNLLRRISDDSFLLRGVTLSLPVLLRTTVRFCPDCVRDDAASHPELGQGAVRLRWSWLLRPVVRCPLHVTSMVECSTRDSAKAFDLPTLLAHHQMSATSAPPVEPHLQGKLQSYVLGWLDGRRDASAWLDKQTIAQGVKACEMLGSLIADGPEVEIKAYTEFDWARVGHLGFDVCVGGGDAISEALIAIRRMSGRRSGRTGPQAVFGKLYRWLEYADRAVDAGPIRGLVRDAIQNSFVIEPGELVFGEAVDRLRVHSVNSLKVKTGLNPKRLYRLLRKAGMIPEDTNQEA
ncbi:TniQ family protein [Rhodobacter sp. CZR27]|uniref:TniQ family protein n=1 Tax=Rhodobacter sp. CZR27 TaxID=2033869 RepID=UPI000BBED510|nr:TniQ family protein [Rhodobacter sp. CZR27]